MTRFEELKNKGWVNLSKEEKAEYQTLKPGDAPVNGNSLAAPTPPPAAMAAPKSETVTMSKADLEALIDAKVAAATKGVAQPRAMGVGEERPYQGPKERVFTATLRKYQKTTDDALELVVDWKHLRFDYDELTRKHDKAIYKVKLRSLVDDSEREVEIPLEEFNKIRDYEKVTILKKVNSKKERLHGYTSAKFTDKEGYTYPDQKTGDKIPLLELRDDFVCTIQFENGKTMEIKEDRLNA